MKLEPRARPKSVCKDGSRTKKSFANEVNIHQIVKRAVKTGFMPTVQETPLYGDFSSTGDFHEVQCKIASIERVFRQLPADIRKRFKHDPAQLIDFVADPENDEEAIKLGLKNRPAAAPAQPVGAVSAPVGTPSGDAPAPVAAPPQV